MATGATAMEVAAGTAIGGTGTEAAGPAMAAGLATDIDGAVAVVAGGRRWWLRRRLLGRRTSRVCALSCFVL